MLTVTDCAAYVRRRLDGDPSVPIQVLVNRAGQYLTDMHTWSWLVRPNGAKLSLIAGNEYVKLPDDFGRIYSQPKPTTVSSVVSLELVSMEEYLRYRQDYMDGGPRYMAVMVYANNEDGVPSPKLQVWPVPQTSAQDAFRVAYIAKWVEVCSDTEVVQIPSWLDYFFLEVLFAFAQSYDEHDTALLSERLALLQQSAEFMNLKRRDGGVQPYVGRLRGGAMEQEYIYESGVKVGLAGRVLPPS